MDSFVCLSFIKKAPSIMDITPENMATGTMTEKELSLFTRYLQESRNYLEFGAGASTIRAAKLENLDSIYSVESSEEYIKEHLLTDNNILRAIRNKKLFFFPVDIGITTEWGHPRDTAKKYLWPNYALSIFNLKKNFDLVLIDGRFRVACALATLLSIPNATIIIHDFWNRSFYHIILNYFDVVAKADTLAVLKKKATVDIEEIQILIAQYQYQPRR